jgi:hypothetical protein
MTLALLKFKLCVSAKSGSDPEFLQRPKLQISRILALFFQGGRLGRHPQLGITASI